MKIILTFILLLTSFFVGAQTEKQNKKPLALNWGLMNFGDTILIDQTEILVGEWLDFVYYNNPYDFPSYVQTNELTDQEKEKLKKENPDISLFPDSHVTENLPYSYVYFGCKNCELIYFSSVASKIQLPFDVDSLKNKDSKDRLIKYLRTPVTGISYEQALQFCVWRTTVDSLRYSKPPKGVQIGPLLIQPLSGESYIFSLPTPTEFDALNPNQDSIANKKGIISNYNYKSAKYSNKKNKHTENNQCGKTLMENYSFFNSTKSVVSSTLDMQGNAAEMTSKKGIAKGGSYYHYAKDSKRGINNPYSKAEVWLGFRCVAKRRK